jgi:hypothetical protein
VKNTSERTKFVRGDSGIVVEVDVNHGDICLGLSRIVEDNYGGLMDLGANYTRMTPDMAILLAQRLLAAAITAKDEYPF